MIPNSPTIPVPIKTDEHGVIRVSGTRVTLNSLIYTYLEGGTAEYVHESFDTVPIVDIHTIIAYYLRNRDEVDAYLKQQALEYKRIRSQMEAEFPPKYTKSEWTKQYEEKKKNQDR